MTKIPKYDDIIRISDILNREFADELDLNGMMEIVFNVEPDMVNRVNEDFYYRFNSEGSPEPADEVKVKANGITFRYVKAGE